METRKTGGSSTIHHSFPSDMIKPLFPSSSSSSSSSSVASSENNSTTTHTTDDSSSSNSADSDSKSRSGTASIQKYMVHEMEPSIFPTDEDQEGHSEDESRHSDGPGWEGIYEDDDEDDDEQQDGNYTSEEDDDDDDDEDDDEEDEDEEDSDDDASGMSVIGSPSHAWASLLPVLLSTTQAFASLQASDIPDSSSNWYENININSFQQIFGSPAAFINNGAAITPTSSLATSITAGSVDGSEATASPVNGGGTTTDASGDEGSSQFTGSGINTPTASTATASVASFAQTTQQQVANTLAANTIAMAYNALNAGLPAGGSFPSIHFSFPAPTAAFLQSLGVNLLSSGPDDELQYDILETINGYDDQALSDIDDGDLVTFIQNLYQKRDEYGIKDKISSNASQIRNDACHRQGEVTDKDVEDGSDCQAIPWGDASLGITRQDARTLRRKLLKNFRNFQPIPTLPRPRSLSSTYHCPEVIPSDQQLFRFKCFHGTERCRPTHFQLRNLISANSQNDVYYAAQTSVHHMDPTTRSSKVLFDIGNYSSNSPTPQPFRITTMVTSKQVLVAGGYSGQYALKSLYNLSDSEPTIGIVSPAQNGITNHVHLHTSRTSSSPVAVFCSNDAAIRRLDCTTNQFIGEAHTFGEIAVNCAATSPDTRLRVVVGDSKSVFIVDADRGSVLRELKGHTDFGFAAAWSDDGIHVATGNQDMTVRIYDARKFDEPIKVLQADMAGVRGLRFSPTGMGKKVLAMAEPTDIIHIVDADRGMFDREQKWDCFGNIGGIDFTDDGEHLFLANTDRWYGGVVRFERERYQHGKGDDYAGWESRTWSRRAHACHMEELFV